MGHFHVHGGEGLSVIVPEGRGYLKFTALICFLNSLTSVKSIHKVGF